MLWDWADSIQQPQDSVPWAPAALYTCGIPLHEEIPCNPSVLPAERNPGSVTVCKKKKILVLAMSSE